MDIGGSRSGAVSGSMNMVGNLGAALSAVVFPFFVRRVTIPSIAPIAGTANSFFVFAAVINLFALAAWLLMNPQRKLRENLSMAELRIRLAGFILLIMAVVAALIYTKFLL
jgi:ACS family glucarate transporter-like MFS transporter